MDVTQTVETLCGLLEEMASLIRRQHLAIAAMEARDPFEAEATGLLNRCKDLIGEG